MANIDWVDVEHFQPLDSSTILWARRMIRLIDAVLAEEEVKLLPANASPEVDDDG